MPSASTATEFAADAHQLLNQRNRDGALAEPAQWNVVLETILNHRSVRGFLPKALPEGTLELLVAAAQSASTSSNLQFWSVVAVQEAERKSRLAELAGQQQFIRDAPLLLVWLADMSRINRIAAERQAQVDGTHYVEEFIVGVVDAALAAQSALIAAESLGLGGVYIGAMRNVPEQVATELALPPHTFAVFGMSLGYPDPARETGIKPRLPQSVVLHREQYSTLQRSEAIDSYNTTMRDFQREQGMRAIDWTQQCFDRVKDGAALRGRDRMREALRNLGFELR
ncbi:MAG TPA: NADPH-dependent oxidoreductase [Acetobacteraceae bacterium]|jgi:nitroreductase|nr:NADPH-dependent oxidoreductase [Acetobacteraceae bacterium]